MVVKVHQQPTQPLPAPAVVENNGAPKMKTVQVKYELNEDETGESSNHQSLKDLII